MALGEALLVLSISFVPHLLPSLRPQQVPLQLILLPQHGISR
jgi:hypothetical protein